MIRQRHGNLKYKYRNRSFWCIGYYVDTAGRNGKRYRRVYKESTTRGYGKWCQVVGIIC